MEINNGELEKYEDMLPIVLMTYIDNAKYINNLKKKKLWYEYVQPKVWERREKIQFLNTSELLEFEEKELNEWLKKE